MTPDQRIKNAMEIMAAGDREQARRLLEELLKSEKRRGPRLQIILGLVAALNRRTERGLSLKLCEEALSLTQEKSLSAQLTARKATLIFDEVGDLEHARGQIVFAPNQIGFATEVDKDEYRALSEKISAITKESQDLINTAAELAKDSGDLTAQAEILSTMAENMGTHYMHYQMRSFGGNERLTSWHATLLRRLIYKLGLPFSLMLAKGHRIKLRQLEVASITFFDRSINFYHQAGKELEEGYVLYSTALQLRTFGRFRRAKKYLQKARHLAEKSGDKFLLSRIDELAYSIKVKGKDIPDYLNGETRESKMPNPGFTTEEEGS